jgi:hypothetical protein
MRRGPLALLVTAVLFVATARGESAAPPTITRFAPAGGPPGTRVTLTGVGFAPDVRVAYGTRPLAILGRPSPGSLTLAIPSDATERAPFVVSTRGGSTQSGAWFELELPAVVTTMTPTSGPPETPITIRGNGFHGDEHLRAGSEDLAVVERQRWGIVVKGPRRSGALTLVSAGRSVPLPFRFDVTTAFGIESFAPAAGPPGTRVTLRGPGTGGAARVLYGDLPCAIVERGAGEIVVAIPPGAAGEDAFVVESLAERARSADRYRVAVPTAKIGDFNPRAGRPGTEVTLAADGLGADVEIWFGDARCPGVRREARRIVFVIPDDAAGRGPFILVEGKGRRSTTAAFFEVTRY